MVIEAVTGGDAGRMGHPERCIKLSVPIAVKNVKFRFNRLKTDQFTVEIVLQSEDDLDIRFDLQSTGKAQDLPQHEQLASSPCNPVSIDLLQL
jgi:hypothetical protein